MFNRPAPSVILTAGVGTNIELRSLRWAWSADMSTVADGGVVAMIGMIMIIMTVDIIVAMAAAAFNVYRIFG